MVLETAFNLQRENEILAQLWSQPRTEWLIRPIPYDDHHLASSPIARRIAVRGQRRTLMHHSRICMLGSIWEWGKWAVWAVWERRKSDSGWSASSWCDWEWQFISRVDKTSHIRILTWPCCYHIKTFRASDRDLINSSDVHSHNTIRRPWRLGNRLQSTHSWLKQWRK